MAKSKLKKKIIFTTSEEITLENLAYRVSAYVEHDDVAYFIALIDRLYESMEVTEQLINHFEALRNKILGSIKPGEPVDDVIELNPKLLI